MTRSYSESETVVRRTLPTASFTLPVSQIEWIAQQAKERRITKAEVVRDLVNRAMANVQPEEQEVDAA